MTDTIQLLEDHQPQHEFLICIDSDGCVFDTMEIKQKECFIPNIIKHWDLQPYSKYARMAAEFVNLYSTWRGINRFPALIKTFDLLAEWDVVLKRGYTVPDTPNLRRWIETETRLGNPALEAYCAAHDEADMHRALAWSTDVNKTVGEVVKGGLPPFPLARETFERGSQKADLLVCSQTPTEALQREWQEQGLDSYVFAIAGQEAGTKTEHIALASEGRYDTGRVLMIGDAPGDRKAATANGALFYPILPGAEEDSWARLHDEALDKFFTGQYAGDYEAELIRSFEAQLPETPPWKR
jgi:phosphoglycolate phosphatase-like HAD superfamily hydrolase